MIPNNAISLTYLPWCHFRVDPVSWECHVLCAVVMLLLGGWDHGQNGCEQAWPWVLAWPPPNCVTLRNLLTFWTSISLFQNNKDIAYLAGCWEHWTMGMLSKMFCNWSSVPPFRLGWGHSTTVCSCLGGTEFSASMSHSPLLPVAVHVGPTGHQRGSRGLGEQDSSIPCPPTLHLMFQSVFIDLGLGHLFINQNCLRLS